MTETRTDMLYLGDIRFDPQRNTLEDKDGKTVALRPQSVDVLRVLAAHAGTVVSKDSLLEEVWGDIAVTDDSLTQCIADIRRALGPQGAKALRTIPKKGYLLEKSAEAHPATDDKTEAPVAQRRRGALAAALALIVIAVVAVLWIGPRTPPPRDDPPVLAIMPFRCLVLEVIFHLFSHLLPIPLPYHTHILVC